MSTKIFLIGASGPLGKEFLKKALAKGHAVTALEHTPGSVTENHANLSVRNGDVMDPECMLRLIPGHDAVVNFLGVKASVPDSRVPPLRSVGTQNTISAMHKAGVRRLVCVTSQGAGNTRFSSGIFGWLIVPVFMRKRFRDVNLQEKYIQQSNLDYTIVRPPMLTLGPFTGKYRHGRLFTLFFSSLSRADLADFVVRVIENNEYMSQAVSVQN